MEFQIDVDFQNRKTEMFINGDDDLFPEMGDEDDRWFCNPKLA